MAAKSIPPALTFEERIALSTAPGWRPEKGEALREVTVIGMAMSSHPEFGDSPRVTYRKTDGTFVAVYVFHQVLRDRLKELGTTIGSVQNLVFLGEEISNKRVDSNGNPQKYAAYYVENVGDELKAIADNFAF